MNQSKIECFKEQIINKAKASLTELNKVPTAMYLYNPETEDSAQINSADFGTDEDFLYTSMKMAETVNPGISILLGLMDETAELGSGLFVLVIEGEKVSHGRYPLNKTTDGKYSIAEEIYYRITTIDNADFMKLPPLKREA